MQSKWALIVFFLVFLIRDFLFKIEKPQPEQTFHVNSSLTRKSTPFAYAHVFDLFSLANKQKCMIKVNGKFIWPNYRSVGSKCFRFVLFAIRLMFFLSISRIRSTCRNLQMNESFKEKFKVCCSIEMNDAHSLLIRMHSYTKWRVQLNRLAFYAQMTCKRAKWSFQTKSE